MGGIRAQARTLSALLCLFVFAILASTASARPGALVVSWQAPTPADGAQLRSAPGSKVTVQLAAVAAGGPVLNVQIGSQGVPQGAALSIGISIVELISDE